MNHRNDYYGRHHNDDDNLKRRKLSIDEGNDSHYHRRNHPRRPIAPPRKNTTEWPSPFEESGANYVFDARSGLFFEAATNYFYDPKNKLYYSNSKKVYVQYCPENENSDGEIWKEVKPTEDHDGGRVEQGVVEIAPQDLVQRALQGGSKTNVSNNKTDKKKINICIKKKFVGSANLKANIAKNETIAMATAAASTAVADNNLSDKQSLAQKNRHADIEKWNQRAEENKGEKIPSTLSSSSQKSKSNINDAFLEKRRVKVTKQGKPICILCKRKFSDIEKLKQHENLSALHRQNLAHKRKKESNAAAAAAAAAEYRDRAKERRTMYGPDTVSNNPTIDPSIVDMGPSLEKARDVISTESIAPDQMLDEKNIGNQLLQKLGWDGGALGRIHNIEGGDTNNKSSGTQNTMNNNLKKDWERIESLAGKRH
mmetsp:Transcript_6672/g.7517  ORF Transcript_6672/g.7517 Transcript_6672/m.7517 type:complete len:426 (-) Transcript_6672:83-1360(-)